jgi:hypothetical protein
LALSNWDTAAWDQDGNPMEGKLTVGQVSIEIYKNWIYVRDSECWKDGLHSFGHNAVMEIQFGDITYRGFRIRAIRGPQNSIMAAVEYGYKSDKEYQAMFAIGGYGYSRDVFVGIQQKTIEKFRTAKYFQDEGIVFPEFKALRRYNQGDAFISRAMFGTGPKEVCTEVGQQKPTIMEQALG